MNGKQKILIGVIIALAVFFRFYQITRMPGGLFPDEAANGLDINLMQQGHLQPFYERGNGREALFFYLEWGFTRVFGLGQTAFHMTSAFIGTLAVAMCFLVTRRLFMMDVNVNDEDFERKKNRAITIALLASFLMAVSSWHVVLSRTALRANMIPLMAAATFYFFLAAYQAQTSRKKLLFSFLAGAAFAGGFYTYIAFRIMVPIVGILVAWPLLAKIRFGQFWKTVNSYKLLAASFLIGFVIIIFPIARYFYTHPGSFVGRAGQVSIFNQTLYTVNGVQLTRTPPLRDVAAVAAEVLKKQILGFFTSGDLNWRQNISGYPFLSPLVSPFFGAALIVITILAALYLLMPNKRAKWWKFTLLAGWFWGMLLPVISTAEGIPHGLRGIGVIPPVFILSALGLYYFGVFLARIHKSIAYKNPRFLWRSQLVAKAFKLAVGVFCAALIVQTYSLYFVYAANSAEYFYAFRSDLTAVSNYLNQNGDRRNTYLILDKYSVQTTDYLTTVDGAHPNNPRNKPYMQVDPENAWQLPKLLPGDQVVFTQSSMFDTVKFKRYHPEAHLHQEIRDKFGAAAVAVYKVY